MTRRFTRLAICGALAIGIASPVAPAHAWSCEDEVGRALCFVVGTACRPVPEKYRDLCTFS